jgi:cell division protein FtsB
MTERRRGRRPHRDPVVADAEQKQPARQRGRTRGRRVARRAGFVAGGACALGLLAVGVFPTRTFLQQRAATSESQQRLAVLRQENEAMQARIDRLQTPEEIERLAREQYNLVFPGEEAYAVLPTPLPPLDLPTVWPFGSLQPASAPTP